MDVRWMMEMSAPANVMMMGCRDTRWGPFTPLFIAISTPMYLLCALRYEDDGMYYLYCMVDEHMYLHTCHNDAPPILDDDSTY